MTTLDRLPKQSPVRLQPMATAEQDSEQVLQSVDKQTTDRGQINLNTTQPSPAMIMHLQRTIGNHAVQQMLNHNQQRDIRMVQSPTDHDSKPVSSTAKVDGENIQRAIQPLEGASSGLLKGRRDKINLMVNAYNTLEESSEGLAGLKALLPEIQKIWQAAKAWQLEVIKKTPQKAASIGEWIKNAVEREEDTTKAQIDAYSGSTEGAGVLWLQDSALAPIYKDYIVNKQYEKITLDAYEDVTRYRQNPTRAEALRIYDQYEMDTADVLNITGEHAGGVDGINKVRQAIVALRGNPVGAPPANFGPIETSLINVINELFVTFKQTEPFKKVITPPK